MSQIDHIIKSLQEIVSGTAALATTLPGGLHHGQTLDDLSDLPYGTLLVEQENSQQHTSRVAIVDYFVILKVYVSERVDRAGEIVRVFYQYFNRISGLPSLDATQARFVLISPGAAKVEEDKSERFGKDIIVGSARWLLRIEEFQTEIVA